MENHDMFRIAGAIGNVHVLISLHVVYIIGDKPLASFLI